MYKMIIDQKILDRFWDKVDKTEKCWLFRNGTKRMVYGTIGIGGKTVKSHILSWLIHNGSIPDGLYVCHKCDNRPCVRPEHLFLGTQSDNMKDAMNKGRISVPRTGNKKQGVRRNNAKLNDIAVREIRDYFETYPSSYEELGLRFNVSASAIWKVINRKTWQHVN